MVRESLVGRRSLVTDLFILCTLCTRKYSLSSPYNSLAKTLNRQSVLAMRVAGHGLASLKKFCRIMSLPPPVTDRAFCSQSCGNRRITRKQKKKCRAQMMMTSLMLLSPWMALGLNVVSHLSSKLFLFCPVKQGRYLTMRCYPSTVMSAGYMKESINPVPVIRFGGEVMKETAV